MDREPSDVQARLDDGVERHVSHLIYEIQMLATLPNWVLQLEAHGPSVLKNATLESLLLHERAVIEFLAGRPRNGERHWKTTDLRPSMFVEAWSLADGAGFDESLGQLDKHLVHLTKARGGDGDGGGAQWALEDSFRILDAASVFADALIRAGSRHGRALREACRPSLALTAVGSLAVTWPQPEHG